MKFLRADCFCAMNISGIARMVCDGVVCDATHHCDRALSVACAHRPNAGMNRLPPLPDRYKAILRVNKTAHSKSSAEEVFHGFCAVLKKLVPFDRAALTVYDSDRDSLRIQALNGPYESSVFRVGFLLSRRSSQSGWTFEHRRPTIRRDLAREFRFLSEKQTLDEGYRSLCSGPLIVRDVCIGVVTVVGTRRNQFSATDARLVQALSNQIAMAIVSTTLNCSFHPTTRLVCPRCMGATGGKTTVLKHRKICQLGVRKAAEAVRSPT